MSDHFRKFKRENESEISEDELFKLIDEEGAKMDAYLKDSLIKMSITFPEGSMDAQIDINGKQNDQVAYYLLMVASTTVITNMVKDGLLDPDRVGEMVDGMTELLKQDIEDQIQGSGETQDNE